MWDVLRNFLEVSLSRLIAIIPTKEEFLSFLEKNPHQTYTSLAKHFDLEMGTIRDLVRMYRDSLTILKIGTALMVDLKGGDQ
ncbi:MAG: hypothetical protein KC535_02985 [Nanoarchaeota archaeon]|nr:hypothetical protein [Nanoarchaeota archaeon]